MTSCWDSCFSCFKSRSQGLHRTLLDGSSAAAPNNCETASWPKRLYFVRHGQSEYNVHYDVHGMDPMNMWDAPLTSLGTQQATSLQTRFATLGPVDLAVMSPLTRAMQTCLLAIPLEQGMAKRYAVTPLASEHMEASCDIGRTPSELAVAFPKLDLSGIPEVWWYVPEECRAGITPDISRKLFSEEGRREPSAAFDSRVDAFAAWLSDRSEGSIAVFAHADFFHILLSRHFGKRDARYVEYWMKNCELLELEVSSPQDLLNPSKPQPKPEPEQPQLCEELAKQVVPSAASLALKILKEEIARSQPDLKTCEAHCSSSSAMEKNGSCGAREVHASSFSASLKGDGWRHALIASTGINRVAQRRHWPALGARNLRERHARSFSARLKVKAPQQKQMVGDMQVASQQS
eukprot:TRINITY_DN35104_c0_g1_i1.p1 TRINITY_DN35104_c0_g1~~TRINITY_DN35104_c0_g1_i1.p1  ORF type:complete len:405 (+),score=63.52 TRINITY_DN35104_c0_g1_i1:122-1336(+)